MRSGNLLVLLHNLFSKSEMKTMVVVAAGLEIIVVMLVVAVVVAVVAVVVVTLAMMVAVSRG